MIFHFFELQKMINLTDGVEMEVSFGTLNCCICQRNEELSHIKTQWYQEQKLLTVSFPDLSERALIISN